MNKNSIGDPTLIRTITDMFMNQDCDEFGVNVNKIYHIYQIAYEIYNLFLIITTINVYDINLYQINKLIDIYAITWREYLCIGIGHIISQASIYVFMLPSKFNCSHDNDLLLFHLMAMKMDGFGLIVAVINSINTIIFQVDHCCVILIVIINKFLMTVMDIFKLFCISFCNTFLIDSVENWFIFIVSNQTPIFNTILWIMITFMCEFYVILYVLIYFDIRINDRLPFNIHSVTVQTTSNHGQMTVQRGSNVRQRTVKQGYNHVKQPTQQKCISKIRVWIHVLFINIMCKV